MGGRGEGGPGCIFQVRLCLCAQHYYHVLRSLTCIYALIMCVAYICTVRCSHAGGLFVYAAKTVRRGPRGWFWTGVFRTNGVLQWGVFLDRKKDAKAKTVFPLPDRR